MQRNTYKVTCILPASYYHEFQVKARSIEEAEAMAENWVCNEDPRYNDPNIIPTSIWEERYNDKIECNATEINKPQRKHYYIIESTPTIVHNEYYVYATSEEEAKQLFSEGKVEPVTSWKDVDNEKIEHTVGELYDVMYTSRNNKDKNNK